MMGREVMVLQEMYPLGLHDYRARSRLNVAWSHGMCSNWHVLFHLLSNPIEGHTLLPVAWISLLLAGPALHSYGCTHGPQEDYQSAKSNISPREH